MRKKLIVSLFCICISMGCILSISSFKSVKSLITLNIEALTQRTWDGTPIPSLNSGDPGVQFSSGPCGVVGIEKTWDNYYYGRVVAYCHMSSSDKENYRTQPDYFQLFKWCCNQCPNTCYCNDD